MCCKKKEESTSVLKVILIVLGVITAVCGIAVLLCKLFRKYFTIQFECSDDCDDCENPCFDEEGAVEPECCEVPSEKQEPDAPAEA